MLETGAPTGFEAAAQWVWTDHLSDVAEEVRTGANSVSVQPGSIPTRYMHTPVEVMDTADLIGAVDGLAGTVERAGEFAPFAVEP